MRMSWRGGGTRVAVFLILAAAALLASCAGLARPPAMPPDSMLAQPVPPAEDREASEEALSRLSPEERSVYTIYRGINKAVVNITNLSVRYNLFLRATPEGGTGSGSIIDPAGLVLTNLHVIKGAEKLYVTLHDGSSSPARVVGVDPENDLAVIRFDPQGKTLPTVPFGVSADVVVGQQAIAVGNPFGLERTLTVGVISGLRRPLSTEDGFIMRELIQTDAAINPGNSGGPLLNGRGEMIGINTMILSPAGGNIGIGFAVPVDTAKRVIPDLIAYGRVRRGWIDIVAVPLFPSLVQAAKLSAPRGMLVTDVKPGSPAAESGLRGGSKDRHVHAGGATIPLGGDVILAVNGTPVSSIPSYLGALEGSKPGDTAELAILRNGTEMTLKIVLSERPGSMPW